MTTERTPKPPGIRKPPPPPRPPRKKAVMTVRVDVNAEPALRELATLIAAIEKMRGGYAEIDIHEE